jgi:cobalt/nickel transport system permease protein
MSHLHVPDGILPVWLWLTGIGLATAVLLFSLFMVRGMDLKKKIPLLGMMSAMMLVGMSLEIVPIAYHVNLSVITGIILGPWLAIIAAFMVNILMAMAGHGGITVVGLNTLVVGAEGVVGWALFRAARRLFKPGLAAGLSTLVTLFMSTCIMLSIVFIANVDFTSEGAHGLREVIESPTFTTLLGTAKLNGSFNFRLFAYAAFGLGSLGWSIEALVTGAAVKFISAVKPDMVR